MASEIKFDATTGTICYAQVRNAAGQIWRIDTVAFEAYDTANIAHYNIPMVEQGSASGFFVGTMPVVAAGIYSIEGKQRAGGSPAESDLTVATGNIEWDGTAELARATIATQTTKLTFDASNNIKTASNIKTNQALANFRFLMTDSTNHAPATGKTVTATRGIDSGAQATGTLSAVTEIGNGEYRVDFGAGDLNGKVIVLRCTATGCDDWLERIVTEP